MSPLTEDGLRVLLRAERVVPVLRADGEQSLRRQVAMCLDAGLQLLELTATSPGWERVLAELTADPALAAVVIGVGTVLDVRIARSALDAGARFLVAPCAVPGVRAGGFRVPLIEGGFTPTEVLSLAAPGRVVKLFPAASGGPDHLAALLDVAPGRAIVPTGGVTPDTAEAWLRAGAIAVGMGGALVRLPVEDIRSLHRRLLEIRPEDAA